MKGIPAGMQELKNLNTPNLEWQEEKEWLMMSSYSQAQVQSQVSSK